MLRAALNLGLVYMGRYPHHRGAARVERDLNSAKTYLELASNNGNEQAKEILAGWNESKVWYCIAEVAPATPLGIEPERNRLKAVVKFHTYFNRMEWKEKTFECTYEDGVKICRNGQKIFGFDMVLKDKGDLDFYYVAGAAKFLTIGNGSCEAF